MKEFYKSLRDALVCSLNEIKPEMLMFDSWNSYEKHLYFWISGLDSNDCLKYSTHLVAGLEHYARDSELCHIIKDAFNSSLQSICRNSNAFKPFLDQEIKECWISSEYDRSGYIEYSLLVTFP